MNNTIWKYALETTDVNDVFMPLGAEILCIQIQNGRPCLWTMVDSLEHNGKSRIIETYGTGHPIPVGSRKYIGTYQIISQGLAFHVFEKL
jgi:hypothetical protein